MDQSDDINLLSLVIDRGPEQEQDMDEMDRTEDYSFLTVSTDLIQFNDRVYTGKPGSKNTEKGKRCELCVACVQQPCLLKTDADEICVCCVMGCADCLIRESCEQWPRQLAVGIKEALIAEMSHNTQTLKSLGLDIKRKNGIDVTFRKDLGLLVKDSNTLNQDQLLAMRGIVTYFPTAQLRKGGEELAGTAVSGLLHPGAAGGFGNSITAQNNGGATPKTSVQLEIRNALPNSTIASNDTDNTCDTSAGTESGMDMTQVMGLVQQLSKDLHDSQRQSKKVVEDMQSQILSLNTQNSNLQKQIQLQSTIITQHNSSVNNTVMNKKLTSTGCSVLNNTVSSSVCYSVPTEPSFITTTSGNKMFSFGDPTGPRSEFGFGSFKGKEKTQSLDSVDPITRLAEAIEKTVVGKEDRKSLSSIQIKSLPRLLNCEQEISVADFEIWKRSIQKVFSYYNVDQCLAIQLLRTECGLPHRLQEAIQQCSTVDECFNVFSRMMTPISCLRPQLIRNLTNHARVGEDEDDQIACLDDMLKKLLDYKAFFPHDDINEYQAIAALATFQSVHHVSRIPSLTTEFKKLHQEGNKYVDILQAHLDNERANLYLIITARSLYGEQNDTNLMNVFTKPIGNVGRSNNNRNSSMEDNTDSIPPWRGGTKMKEGYCICCKSVSKHLYFQCPILQEVKESKRHLNSMKHICPTCLRPPLTCVQKTKNKDCSQAFNRKTKEWYSLTCQHHKINTKLCPCPKQAKQKKSIDASVNFISLETGRQSYSDVGFPCEYLDQLSSSAESCDDNGDKTDDENHVWKYNSSEWELNHDALYDVSLELDEEEELNCNVLNSLCDVAPECIFITEKIAVENAGKIVPSVICFDSAAQLSGVAFPNMYKNTLQQVGLSRRLGIRTAHGRRVQRLPIYNFTIQGKMGQYPISTVNLDLPRPTISNQSYNKLKQGGYHGLINNKDYENHIYILLGINYSNLFPQRVSNKYVSSCIRQAFPLVTTYESYLSSNLLLGGPLSAQSQTIHNLIDVTEEDCNEDITLSAQGKNSAVQGNEDIVHFDSNDEDEEIDDLYEDVDVDDVYKDEDIYYSDTDSDIDDDESHYGDSDIYWSDEEDDIDDDRVWDAYSVNEKKENVTICTAVTEGLGENGRIPGQEVQRDIDSIGVFGGIRYAEYTTKAKGIPVKALYKLFLKEYSQHCSTGLPAGCHRCDDRVKAIRNANVNTLRLKTLIKWEQIKGKDIGIFKYYREHLNVLRCLPDGKYVCEMRMKKLCEKLKPCVASRQFLNYTVARDHLNQMTQWLEDVDSKITTGKLVHCIPYLVVFNKNSASSPLRLVQQANSKFKSICDKKNCTCVETEHSGKKCEERLSYNQCLPTYNTPLPALQMLATKARMSIRNSGADVKSFFRALENCIETQLLNTVQLYQCRNTKLPTFDSHSPDGKENDIKILLHKRQLFGLADLPSASIVALQMSYSEYAKIFDCDYARRKKDAALLRECNIESDWLTCHKCQKFRNFIQGQAKDLIFNKCYVDDVVHYTTLKNVDEFVSTSRNCDIHVGNSMEKLDINTPTEVVHKIAEKIELYTMAMCVLIFRHSNFYLKSFEGTGINSIVINALIERVKPLNIEPSFPRPTVESIHSENIKNTDQKRKITKPKVEQKTKPYLTQLALNFYLNGTVGLRNTTLKFPVSKTKHVEIGSFQEFDFYHKERGLTSLTRRQLSSLLGQSYDSHTGVQLIFPITILKFVVAKASQKLPGWDWEDHCPNELWELILAGVKLMFDAFESIQSRCSFTWQLDCQVYCILMVDASSTLTAHTIHLVQRLNVGSIPKSNIQNISNKVHLGKSKDPSIPIAELTALENGVEDLSNILNWLKEIGIYVHERNILILSDSTTVILQTRLPPAQLKVKQSNIIARIVVNLSSHRMTPFSNLYHFSQSVKPFLADRLTKVNMFDNHTKICEDFNNDWAKGKEWMETDPAVWKEFISRNPPIGKDYEIKTQKLGLTNACNTNLIIQIIQVKAEVFIPHKFTIADGLNMFENIHRHKVPSEVMCNTTTAENMNEDQFREIIECLIKRKMSHAGEKKGPLYILSLCLFYGLKLKKLSKLSTDLRKRKKENLKNALKQRLDTKGSQTKIELASPTAGHHPYAAEHMNMVTKNSCTKTSWQQLVKSIDIFDNKAYYILKEQILSALASLWPGKEHNRLDVFETKLGNLPVFYGCGRLQCSFASTNYKNWGRVKLRLIEKYSILGRLVINIAHTAAGHQTEATKFHLYKMQISMKGVGTMIKNVAKNCVKCRLKLIAGASVQQLVMNNRTGCSTNLANIAVSPKDNHLCLDFFGLLVTKLDQSHKTQKLWVLMIISHTTQCVHYQILSSTSALHVQCAIDIFCQNWGGVSTVWSDQQSSFLPICNTFSINQKAADMITDGVGKKLKNPLKRLIELQNNNNQNCIKWRCIIGNCHWHVGQVENLVKLTKSALKRSDFFRKAITLTRDEIDAAMSRVVSVLNNRPLYCIDSEILTPNHLKYMSIIQFDQTKSLQIDLKTKSEREKLKQFENLKEKITQITFMATMKGIHNTARFNQRARFGFNCKFLEVDDIIVDYLRFRKNKSISKSLARIYALSENKRSAILYYASGKRKMSYETFLKQWMNINNENQKQKLALLYLGDFTYYSMPTDSLYFLTRTHSDNFDFETFTGSSDKKEKFEDICFDFNELQNAYDENVKSDKISVKILPQKLKDLLNSTNLIQKMLKNL